MSKHTPGPWEISRGYTNSGYPCFWINGMSGDEKRDVATLDANARLIAEAPDLLEAARRVTALDDDPHPGLSTWCRMRSEAGDMLRAAIAKAQS